MERILFVCLGNICRSAMAECIFADLVRQSGLTGEYHMDSAGVSDEEEGNPIYYAAREKLTAEGVPLLPHRARQMTRQDYGRFDRILAMDTGNLSGILRICGGDPQKKVSLLLDSVGEHRSIPDPWYTRDFDAAYRDIRRGCEALLRARDGMLPD